MGIMRTKSVEQSIRDTEEPEFQLHKALGPQDLTVFGIGVIIGTGLFVLTGEAAAGYGQADPPVRPPVSAVPLSRRLGSTFEVRRLLRRGRPPTPAREGP